MTKCKRICCVCGSTDDITKHHIVPKQYMKYMSKTDFRSFLKTVPICHKHHREYEERHAMCLNKKISKTYNVEMIHTTKVNVFAKEVVSKIVKQKDFAYMWRRNFIDKMNPKYIPIVADKRTFRILSIKEIVYNIVNHKIRFNLSIYECVNYISAYAGIGTNDSDVFTGIIYNSENIILSVFDENEYQLDIIAREINIKKILDV